MARPRKLNATKLGHRTKEELEAAEKTENTLNKFIAINVDDVPGILTDEAAEEWKRVVPLLESLPIAELDYDRVTRYCQVVALTNDAYRHILQFGYVTEDGSKRTPQYQTYMDGLKELKSLCGSLGMTIDSRMRMVVPSENEKKQSVYDTFGVDEDD